MSGATQDRRGAIGAPQTIGNDRERDRRSAPHCAVRAAEAATCAGDQGTYWRYHDTLYLNQNGANSFTDARLEQMTQTLGLDTAAFNRCLDSGEKKAGIGASIMEAKAQGIDSTPTILINGTEIAEWHDFNAVKQGVLRQGGINVTENRAPG
jgi:protein-disulfide isomerase